jgi:phage terminase large subunit GpA-like protein
VNEEQLFSDWSKLWEPPTRLPLSHWAEEFFFTSPEYSSKTSKLRLHKYQREPLDCFTDPRVSDIVISSGTQMLKTLFMQIALAYVAIEDPGPCLLSQYKEADVEQFVKERVVPMIRDIPGLQRIPSLSSKSRSSGSTTTYKEFPGGSWSFVGAGTAGNAARRSIRYAFFDEINKYEPTKEGPFTDLAVERTATFLTRAKRVFCCSPTTPEGEISRRFQESDQRRLWAKCTTCGELQKLKWAQVRWDSSVPREDQPATARYECENSECGARWDDVDRLAACDQGEWIAEKPFRGIAGFGELGHLYSPYKTLRGMVHEWLNITADKSSEMTGRLRKFINTNLAEEYVERGDAPEWQRLYDRRENYPLALVPDRALFLTASADVQKDRIEVSAYAWGRGKESWLVDHLIIEGDTSTFPAPVWNQLDVVVDRVYHHETGVDMPLVRFAIDSGHNTQIVYAWARQRGYGQVMVVKGQPHGPIVGLPTLQDVNSRGQKIARGIRVWPVNVSALKTELYSWLNLNRPTVESGDLFPPGYCHFPEMDQEFFEQLCAEQLITRKVNGYRKQEWHKVRDRNEALDLRNYARAAASVFGIDRFSEMQWLQLEAAFATEQVEAKKDDSLVLAAASTEEIFRDPLDLLSPDMPKAGGDPRRHQSGPRFRMRGL